MKYRVIFWFLFLGFCLFLSYFRLITPPQYVLIVITGAIIQGMWILGAYKKSNEIVTCSGCGQARRTYQIKYAEEFQDYDNGCVEWRLGYCEEDPDCEEKVRKSLEILLADEDQRRLIH